jgi:hypothetical protein
MPIVTATLFTQPDPFQRRLRRLFEEVGVVPPDPLPAPRVYETPDEYVLEIRVRKDLTGSGSSPRGSSSFGRDSTRPGH